MLQFFCFWMGYRFLFSALWSTLNNDNKVSPPAKPREKTWRRHCILQNILQANHWSRCLGRSPWQKDCQNLSPSWELCWISGLVHLRCYELGRLKWWAHFHELLQAGNRESMFEINLTGGNQIWTVRFNSSWHRTMYYLRQYLKKAWKV